MGALDELFSRLTTGEFFEEYDEDQALLGRARREAERHETALRMIANLAYLDYIPQAVIISEAALAEETP